MLKRILAALLALAVLAGCAVSCESEKPLTAEDIAGTYEYTLSFDTLAKYWKNGENELLNLVHQYSDFTFAEFTLCVTLFADGKYECFADYESFFESYKKVLVNFYEYAFIDTRAASDIFALCCDNLYDLDSALELQGLDKNDFLAANKFLFEDEETVKAACRSMAKSVAFSGEFTFSEPNIYLTADKTEFLNLNKLKLANGKTPYIPEEEKNEHSDIYNENYTVDEVLKYFEEVVLTAEYSESEQSRRVQKWLLPIYYSVEGDLTEKDNEVLTDFAETLNSVTGFPGFYPVTGGEKACLEIKFYDGNDLMTEMGEVVNGERSDGIVQYWYLLDNSIIYAAKIGYDNGVSQRVRSSVIVEEIMNAIGFSNDTVLRQDSVIYEKYTENYALSEMDLILLKLLYHPLIKPDMTKDKCFEIIKKLYY